MFGLEDETELLSKLGKHKIGKGCLYIKALSDIDTGCLNQLMQNTFSHMKTASQQQ